MKPIMIALLSVSAIFAADEVADRASITQTIALLSVWPPRPALFTADFDDFGHLSSVMKPNIKIECPEVWAETCVSTLDVSLGHVQISKEPWGEATWTPVGSPWSVNVSPIKVTAIRFITPNVAMVEASGRGPILFVMRKQGDAWKIAALKKVVP